MVLFFVTGSVRLLNPDLMIPSTPTLCNVIQGPILVLNVTNMLQSMYMGSSTDISGGGRVEIFWDGGSWGKDGDEAWQEVLSSNGSILSLCVGPSGTTQRF